MNLLTPDGRRPAALRQCGFTLVEVLVALVVLAIGLLGVASLQITSKRGNLEAQQRALAVLMAEDLLERMRTNTGALGTYAGAGAGGVLDLTGGVPTVADADVPNCFKDDSDVGVVNCSITDMATYDISVFERALIGIGEELSDGTQVGGLISPTLCITGDTGGTPGLYTVALAWRGPDDLPTPTLSNCGQGNAAYQDGDIDDAPGNRSYRRVISVQAYITPEDA
jgi:type IV pilus assembly protein PilV